MCLIVLFGCAPREETNKLRVVASIEPLAYFAERIGDGRVTVSVMVPPGGTPHSYEPTPKQMTNLGDAALFIKAGSGVEFELDWMQRFIALNPGLKICNAAEGVRLIPLKQDDHDHRDEKVSSHDRFDPHYWLSPANGIIIAENVAHSLAEADPVHRSLYEANLSKLVRKLQELDREIRTRLAAAKNRRFLVFHPAWGYYADAYGLEQIAAEEEGKTLTPQQMTKIIEKAKTDHIRVIFVSPQFSTVQAEAIARDIGGVTGMVDPLSRNYQENLRMATRAFIQDMQ
jgi:zinc transport system substrate-binding protein